MTILSELILNNDVFAGVLGAGMFGALAYHVRAALVLLWHVLVRRFTCEMTVHSSDPAFVYINEWLARRPFTTHARRVHLSTSHEEGEWALSVGEGKHWMLRNDPPLLVTRTFEEAGNSIVIKQRLSLRVLGGGQTKLQDIVDQSMQINQGDGRVEIHLWIEKGCYWRRVVREPSRPLSSIILPGNQAEQILDDARRFFASQSRYVERGVPWRRGYLFHGPPGTGKSSTAAALAGELKKNVYVVSLNALSNDASLLGCVSEIPPGAILLLEDVDSALSIRGRHEEGEPGITLAGLLNAIDGVASGSGRLLIMSSNHPEHLDSTLTRPGRVDARHYFGTLGRAEIIKMVNRFHSGLTLSLPKRVEILPARLQEVLMSAPPGRIVEEIERLVG